MFKERYRKANDSILVNQELLEKLKEKAAEPKKRRFHATRWASAVVAAAVLGIILLSFADLQQFRPKTAAPIASPSQKMDRDSVKIAPSPKETVVEIETKNESAGTREQAVQTPMAENPINGSERADSEIRDSVEESVLPEKSAEKDMAETRSGDNSIFSTNRTADGAGVKRAEDEFSSHDDLTGKENDQQTALTTASDVSLTEPVPNEFEAEVNPGNFNGNSGQGSSDEPFVAGAMQENESTGSETDEKKDDELTDCEESPPPDSFPSPLTPPVPWEVKE